MMIFRASDQGVSDKWPTYELSSVAESTFGKSR